LPVSNWPIGGQIKTHYDENLIAAKFLTKIPDPWSGFNLLHRGLHGLFHLGVDLGGLCIGLAVHPLVEAAPLEAPAIP